MNDALGVNEFLHQWPLFEKAPIGCALLDASGTIIKANRVWRESLGYAPQEIEALRGFLPICASCKKIRTDKGEWITVAASG